jgi:hypothetical protein
MFKNHWTHRLGAGLACSIGLSSAGVSQPTASAALPGEADDYLIVDCLLPGQVRRLGQRTTYLSARRPARLSAIECRIRGGEYIEYDRADSASALRVWQPLADQGDSDAQLLVGEIHERGIGTAADAATAAIWYRKAAEQGNIRAQINLGHLYEFGRGVPQDATAAWSWYRRAAGQSTTVELDPAPAAPVDPRSQILAIEQQLQQRDATIQQLQHEIESLRGTVSSGTQDRERHERDLARARSEQQQLMAELTAARAELQAQAQRAGDAEKRADAARANLAALRRPIEQKLLAGPQLSLIEPSLLATRDVVPVVADGAPTRQIVGRVTAPAGLVSLTINGQPLQPNAQGVFKHALALAPEAATDIRILAVDEQGKQADLAFRMRRAATESRVAGVASTAAPPVSFGRYHALVVGINDYRSLPKLTTPIADAQALSTLLRERYGFQVTTLMNPDRYQLLSALNRYRETLTADDNLLLYYAGHGELDEVNQRGNWLPVDAERDNNANWIPTTVITDLLNVMRAKQVLVIADSCYSGAMTRSSVGRLRTGMTSAERNFWFQTMARKRARVVLSSGGLVPVMDAGGGNHSVFAKALLDVLAENAEPLDGQKLHREVAARVAYAAANLNFDQVPEYAPIRFAGHEAGEFFLVPKP